MKDLFRGYYALEDNDFKELWENGLFIFDTNVLLDLYRYQEKTRDTFLKVIEILADANRVWIPFHVGLEYQRNRLSVISEQQKKYSDVENLISDQINKLTNYNEQELRKRHSDINLDPFISDIKELAEEYLTRLNTLKKKSINIHSEDPIRNKLDQIFGNRIGNKPELQKELDLLFKEADERFNLSIPPGFKDKNKDMGLENCFYYDGLRYQRKYGDFILWRQIIEHAKNNSIKNVIFVSNDNKSDWIWKIENKTIHVRPELISELSSEAAVERFHIYTGERFIEYSKEYLNISIENSTLDEIREISKKNNKLIQLEKRIHIFENDIALNEALIIWFHQRYESVIINLNSSYPDFIAEDGELRLGYEVKILNSFDILSHRYLERIFGKANSYIITNELDKITIVFIANDISILERCIQEFKDIMYNFVFEVHICFGLTKHNQTHKNGLEFEPFDEFYLGNKALR